jgi:parallel beta-helix repeat protein
MISCANLNCSIIDNNFIVCAGTGIYNNSAGSGNISGNTFTFYGSSGTAISMKMSNARITNNCVYGGEYGIYATFDQYCVFTGNTFNGTSNGIYQGHDVGYTVIEENSFQGVTTPIPYPQPNDSICNNTGYIASGEIRTYSGSIVGSANDNRAIMITIDNSFGQAVRVIKVDVEITVQAMGTATMDCGIGLSNSNDYSTMIAGLPINPGTSYPYFYSSTTTPTYSKQKDAVNWETGSGNRYMNFYNPSENPSGIAFRATYTITIMGN